MSDMFWIEYWVVFFKSMLELIDTGRMSFCLFGTAFIWFTLLLRLAETSDAPPMLWFMFYIRPPSAVFSRELCIEMRVSFMNPAREL